jgi:hypothetical protein
MIRASHEDDNAANKPSSRKPRWLPLLERVLKARIGWVDEAISPFARQQREDRAKPGVRQAA